MSILPFLMLDYQFKKLNETFGIEKNIHTKTQIANLINKLNEYGIKYIESVDSIAFFHHVSKKVVVDAILDFSCYFTNAIMKNGGYSFNINNMTNNSNTHIMIQNDLLKHINNVDNDNDICITKCDNEILFVFF